MIFVKHEVECFCGCGTKSVTFNGAPNDWIQLIRDNKGAKLFDGYVFASWACVIRYAEERLEKMSE